MKLSEKIFAFFNTDLGESIIVLIGGGIPASIVSYNIDDAIIRVSLAAVTGLVGGVAALLGKDIYKWVKKKITK